MRENHDEQNRRAQETWVIHHWTSSKHKTRFEYASARLAPPQTEATHAAAPCPLCSLSHARDGDFDCLHERPFVREFGALTREVPRARGFAFPEATRE